MTIVDPDTGENVTLWPTEALSADIAAYHAKFQCDHVETSIRKCINLGGNIQYRNQCALCGELRGNAINKNAIPSMVLDEDVELKNSSRRRALLELETINLRHLSIQKRRADNLKVIYNNYIRTEKWFSIRRKVLQRAGHICEGCGEQKATQAHHLTYDNLGNEFLWELVAVCEPCHIRAHPKWAKSLGEEQSALEEEFDINEDCYE